MIGIDEAGIRTLLEALTDAEKVDLVTGASAWRTRPVPRLDIPELKLSDGPNGVRGDGGRGARATAFPVGSCMAATFDRQLVARVGEAIGVEARDKHVQVVLGPTINLQRTPLGGRNFECYSEDPWLSGDLGAAFVTGVQRTGVAACPKHFVCNDCEFERHTVDAQVDERTLRELYLRPFETVVRRAAPWSLMAAYNRVNGVYACSQAALIEGVLRGELGFDGVVVSDWYAATETLPNALGGLDLEMPGPGFAFGPALLAAVRDGRVAPAVLDAKVERLLRLLGRTGRFAAPEDRPEQHREREDHDALAREVARRGMVLLRNDGVLPWSAGKLRRVAVLGPNVLAPQIMGGGSAQLRPFRTSAPLDALRDALGPEVELVHEPGVLTHKYVPPPPRGWLRPRADAAETGLLLQRFELDDPATLEDVRVTAAGTHFVEPMGMAEGQPRRGARLSGVLQVPMSGDYDFGLMVAGAACMRLDDEIILDLRGPQPPGDIFFGAGSAELRTTRTLRGGRPYRFEIEFASRPDARWAAFRFGIMAPVPPDLFDRAVAAAAAADAVLVLAGTSPDWETEGNDRTALELPGDQDALIAAVCAANPATVVAVNAGSPVAMRWFEDAAAVLHCGFPGQAFGAALADLLLGAASPSGRMPMTVPKRLEDTPTFTCHPGEGGVLRYDEGLFMGYRWYDARDIEPLVPFGHGLSYTHFDYGEPWIGNGAAGVELRFRLENRGAWAATEVVQLYVAPPPGPLRRPPQALQACECVFLEPGAGTEVVLPLPPDAFTCWDPARAAWVTPPGDYLLRLGASSRDIRRTLQLQLPVARG